MDNIKNLIADGKTKEAIDQMLLRFEAQKDKSIYDALIIIKSRFNQISRNKILNLTSDELSQIEVNKINNEILNILNDPKQVSLKEKYPSTSSYTKRNIYVFVFFVLIILLAIAIQFYKNGDQSNTISAFVKLDTKEVNDRIEKLKNGINELSKKDTSLAIAVAENNLLQKIDSYKTIYNSLQNENIKAIKRKDYLYAREVKKKISNLQLYPAESGLRKVSIV